MFNDPLVFQIPSYKLQLLLAYDYLLRKIPYKLNFGTKVVQKSRIPTRHCQNLYMEIGRPELWHPFFFVEAGNPHGYHPTYVVMTDFYRLKPPPYPSIQCPRKLTVRYNDSGSLSGLGISISLLKAQSLPCGDSSFSCHVRGFPCEIWLASWQLVGLKVS